MTEVSRPALVSEGQVDLLAVSRVLWRFRFLVLIFILASIGISVVYDVTATKWYRVEVTLAPVEDDSISSRVQQLGGLANLIGMNLGSTHESKIPLAVMRSREFARDFIVNNNLTDALLAQGGGTDIRDAVRYFDKEIRGVEEDKKSGMILFRITWTDPKLAAKWAVLYVQMLNSNLRGRALAEADRNVKYLQDEIAATTIVSIQQSLGNVLQMQMQKFLLAKGNEEYAFQIVDHPMVPKRVYWPNRVLVLLIGAFLGAVLGVSCALWRYWAHPPRHGSSLEADGK